MKYAEVYSILKNQYYHQYSHLSTSVDIKILGNLWNDFILKNQGHEDELSCFVVQKMLRKDDFAFSIYKELNPDFVSFTQALSNEVMDSYLDKEGLTDGNLAYLNALNYLGESGDWTHE